MFCRTLLDSIPGPTMEYASPDDPVRNCQASKFICLTGQKMFRSTCQGEDSFSKNVSLNCLFSGESLRRTGHAAGFWKVHQCQLL